MLLPAMDSASRPGSDASWRKTTSGCPIYPCSLPITRTTCCRTSRLSLQSRSFHGMRSTPSCWRNSKTTGCGVSVIRVVDPWRRQVSVFDQTGLRNVDALRLVEQGVEVHTEKLFERLPIPERRRKKEGRRLLTT